MQEIVFVTKYYCEICKKERLLRVHGDEYARIDRDHDKEYKEEVIEWGKHYHWIDCHRICAICGKIVISGELDLLENDGRIEIHKDYTDEYRKVEPGDKFGHLLMVHKKCVKEEGEN